MGSTLQIVLFAVIIAAIVFMMFRNGRKRQRDAATLAESLKPGAEVMTTFGLFGTIVSIDDEDNKIVLQTSPTSQMTLHRQAVAKVVTPTEPAEPTEPAAAAAPGAITLNGETLPSSDTPPAYGERVASKHDSDQDSDGGRTGV